MAPDRSTRPTSGPFSIRVAEEWGISSVPASQVRCRRGGPRIEDAAPHVVQKTWVPLARRCDRPAW